MRLAALFTERLALASSRALARSDRTLPRAFSTSATTTTTNTTSISSAMSRRSLDEDDSVVDVTPADHYDVDDESDEDAIRVARRKRRIDHTADDGDEDADARPSATTDAEPPAQSTKTEPAASAGSGSGSGNQRKRSAPTSATKSKRSKLTDADGKNSQSIRAFFGVGGAKPKAAAKSAPTASPRKPAPHSPAKPVEQKMSESPVKQAAADAEPEPAPEPSARESPVKKKAAPKSSATKASKPAAVKKAAPKKKSTAAKSKPAAKPVVVEADDEDVEVENKSMERADADAAADEAEGVEKKGYEAMSADEDEDDGEVADELLGSIKADAAGSGGATQSKLGLASYHPIKDAGWQAGAPVPYAALSAMFEAVEAAEGGRLRIIAIVSDLFRSILALTPDDVLTCVYLCCNSIAPAYEGTEIGVGEHILKKAIADSTGLTLANLNKAAKDHADLGILAMKHRKRQVTLVKSKPLTARVVLKTLREMAEMKGKAVAAKKEGIIKKMMVACEGDEAKFLIRSLAGNLRIKMAERTVVAAIARALVLTPPPVSQDAVKALASKSKQRKLTDSSASDGDMVLDTRQIYSDERLKTLMDATVKALDQAYIEVPNHDRVIDSILRYGVDDLSSHCFLQPGIPVKCMLGKPTSGIDQILDRFHESLFTLEFKYDGERAQIHRLKDGTVKIFSRNSEDNTTKYPDVISRLSRAFDSATVTEFIIDCECLAWDKGAKKILPFQTLSTRKKKDVKEEDVSVQVVLFAFDLLFLNGKSFLNESLRARREALRAHFVPVEGEFGFAESRDTSDVEEIQSFLSLAVESSCEGLMVKALDEDAQYRPAKRNWLKVKKDYLDGLGDTLDLVPIAAFYGKGKRTGVYGAYLLGCYDEETETYQSITKVGTGFSEEDMQQRADFYNATVDEQGEPVARVLDQCPSEYMIAPSTKPDVYLAPCQVWEVKCADLSISPIHRAAIGKVDETKGIALRFPRFMRVRDDKKPEDATNSDQVTEMFENQSVIKAQQKSGGRRADDDDDED